MALLKPDFDLSEDQLDAMKRTQRVLNQSNVSSKEELATMIGKDLIKEYKKSKGFAAGNDKDIGLNTTSAGGLGLLLLVNNLDYDIESDKDMLEVINKTLDYILDYIETIGFDFTPYVQGLKTKEIFNTLTDGKHDYYSIEALTWVLSFFIQIRRAVIDKKIVLDPEKNTSVIKWIERILCYIYAASIDVEWAENIEHKKTPGRGGWGFLNKSKTPSLYYTAMVIESLSEFDDNIIVSDVNLQNMEHDKELLEFLGCERVVYKDKVYLKAISSSNENSYDDTNTLINLFSKEKDSNDSIDGLVQNTSRWIWFNYSHQIINNTFKVDEHYRNDKIYAMIFIVEIMALSYTEQFIDKSIVAKTIESGLFYIDQRMDVLKEDELRFTQLSTYKAEFDGLSDYEENDDSEEKKDKQKQINPTNRTINRLLNKTILLGPNLKPLRIKLGGLYAFFFAKYPDRSMSYELEALLVDLHPDKYLWDSYEYNLLHTEKSIEALVDFFNYYDNFERDYVEIAEFSEELKQQIRNEIEPSLRKDIEKSIREEDAIEHRKVIVELENQINTMEKDLIEGRFIIYKQLKDFINECFDEKYENIQTKKEHDYSKELISLLYKVDTYNRTDDPEANESVKSLSEIFQSISLSNKYQLCNFEGAALEEIISHFEHDYKEVVGALFKYELDNKDSSKFKDVVKRLIDAKIL